MTETSASEGLRKRYLDLVQVSVGNAIYGESALEMSVNAFVQRLRHPWLTRKGAMRWPGRAHTMLSSERLSNIRALAEAAVRENIPGDFIETGVWRGGACIMMRAVLAAYDVRDRKVICADSFEGLPPPDIEKYRQDKRDRLFAFKELAVSVEEVKENFAAYGLLDEQVTFVKGFFRDTLPRLKVDRFALLRLDGDMYESTMDALTALYDKLSPGGYIIIDDYGALKSCRTAVHDYLDAQKLTPDIQKIDSSGVWWRKAG